jgi:hypothetical protein
VTTTFGNARLLQARGAELDDDAGVDDAISRPMPIVHSIIENCST